MKKIMALIVSLLLITSLGGCSIRFGVGEKRNNSNAKEVSINESLEYNGESKLNIDIKYGRIDVKGYDGKDIVVTGTTHRGTDVIKLSKSGDSIRIKDNSSGDVNISLFGKSFNDDTNLEIKVPFEFAGDIEFSYGAGEATLEEIECNKLKIDGGAGKLNVYDIVFNELKFSAGVGQSNIDLSKKCGEIDIDGGVGEVNVTLAEVGGNLTFEGGVGSAKIKIPENSPVYFDTSSGIGNTNISAKTSGENTYKFDLEVGIGEIRIYN